MLGAVNLSEVFGVVISLLRTATALKNLEAPFTSYGFWVDITSFVDLCSVNFFYFVAVLILSHRVIWLL